MPDINTTDQLIELLKVNIEKDKDHQMSAIVGRIPLLCENVLNIHLMLKGLTEGQKELSDKLDKNFVSKDQFWPVKSIVYGATGTILLTVLGWFLTNLKH